MRVKPCPFCKQPYYRISYIDEDKRFMAVVCRSCGASGSLVMADPFYFENPRKTREEVHKEMRRFAIEKWNQAKR